jgi:carbonic anhydrase
MDRLLNGYRRFHQTTWPERRDTFDRLAESGQKPPTLVIACSDSRVDPQMIFDAGPGELFVIRNVAALVPPYAPDSTYHGTSAALEFAVRALNVCEVVVMSHGLCGGLHALIEGVPEAVPDFVGDWIEIAAPAREIAMRASDPAERLSICEHEAVKITLANLRTFPWIEERIRDGRLTLQGCRFDVRTGVLEWLGPDGTFAAV